MDAGNAALQTADAAVSTVFAPAPRPAGAAARAAAPLAAQRALGETPSAWLYILPGGVIILGLAIVPVGWSALLSVQDTDPSPRRPATSGWTNYRALFDDPQFRERRPAHADLHRAVRPAVASPAGSALALLLNRRIRLIGLLPDARLRAGRGLRHGPGRAVLVHLRRPVRRRQRAARRVGLPAQPFFADGGQALLLLVLVGLWAGTSSSLLRGGLLAALQDVPRELVGGRVDRRRAARRRLPHVVAAGARAGARASCSSGRRSRRVQLFDLVYGTTRGGPGQSTTRDRLLRLPQRSALRRRHGRGGVLRARRARCVVLGGARRARPQRAGAGARERRRRARAAPPRLPFNPWHLVLAPGRASLLAMPLVWMLLSSFMSNAQINRFPPTIIPDSLHLDGYRYLFENAVLPRWFLNSTIVSGVCVVVEPRVLLDWPATRSRGCTSAARACCSR